MVTISVMQMWNGVHGDQKAGMETLQGMLASLQVSAFCRSNSTLYGSVESHKENKKISSPLGDVSCIRIGRQKEY
jgi:hypothetical protein